MSWIKVETHTPDKPEVFAIADIMGISSDESFGKCFRVWAWFDAHTTNGKTNGAGVSASLINRVAGVNGFAQAMVDVGWLVQGESGLTVSHFDRHNGETAKQRGLTAKRVAKHTEKSNEETNGNGVSEALPREDKRRSKTPPTPKGEKVVDASFSEFWKAYPNKTGKGAAEKAWQKIQSPANTLLEIVAALSWQSKSVKWTKDGGQFIPNPATYLNSRGWEDSPVGQENTAGMTKEEKTRAWMLKMSGVES